MNNLTISKKKRTFLPENYILTNWDNLKSYFEDLKNREINSTEEFTSWLNHRSELESYISENFAWRYIKMTCDTSDVALQENYQDFVQNIQPHLSVYSDLLNKKHIDLDQKYQINQEGYPIFIRGIKESVKIFREENIPLFTESQIKQSEYQAITGAMSVIIDDEEMTMPKAASFLQNIDRNVRENAWTKISERRFQDHEKLDQNFSDLLKLRNQIAKNAGFNNYRDYMFAAMGRFDYKPEDCFSFHKAVANAVVPLSNELEIGRKKDLGFESYKPWDAKVDTKGKDALKPFTSANELLDKTEKCFNKIDSSFEEYIKIMRNMGHFDVESRKGKAPGGYNYPLEETGVPFIFMNATNTVRDMVTMVHEGGHAIHSFLVRDLSINAYRNPPMEVAELASMAMELISMEHWDAYFENSNDLKRAKSEHLKDILTTLPWIATIDKFQHWLYENPEHSLEERAENWVKIYDEFSDSVTDWNGLEHFKKYSWQRQLHIYEVPFYYIEYGMAQLGAISVWKNYKENPAEAIQNYKNALSLGYTKGIKEIYKAAGIRFDFSQEYISELMQFVKAELDKLES